MKRLRAESVAATNLLCKGMATGALEERLFVALFGAAIDYYTEKGAQTRTHTEKE